MKECVSCGSNSTPKWYSGPKCKTCYGREHYLKSDPIYWSSRASLYRKTERGSYNVTKGNAKKKGIFWGLSFEDFKNIRASGRCDYCHGELPKICGGLDRKDNSLGYTVSNVVACCAKCNYMKRDLLSHSEMSQLIDLLKTLRHGKVWKAT